MIIRRVTGYLAIVIAFFLQGCFLLSNDCSDPEPVYHELPRWIPYEEGSSLFFENATSKDTLLVAHFSRGWSDSPNKCTPPVESINAIITSNGAFSDSLNFHGSGSYITFFTMWPREKIHVQFYARENTFTGNPSSSSAYHDSIVLDGKTFDDVIVSKCTVCVISEIVLARGLGIVSYTADGIRWTRVQ